MTGATPEGLASTPVRPSATVRAGIIASLVLLLIGFLSLVWTPYAPEQTDVGRQLLGPSLAHPFGTDAQGRDALSLTMKGLLTSYVVAAIGIAVGLIVGVPLGILAALLGGGPGRAIDATTGALAIVPALAVAAVLAVRFGPGPIVPILSIGVVALPVFARTTRQAMLIRAQWRDVDAARLAGFSRWEALSRHLGAALVPLLLAQAIMQMGFAVLVEASLSFVGIGARPDNMSLGLMLREAQSYALFEPQLVLVPGVALVTVAGVLLLTAFGLRRSVGSRLGHVGTDDALA